MVGGVLHILEVLFLLNLFTLPYVSLYLQHSQLCIIKGKLS